MSTQSIISDEGLMLLQDERRLLSLHAGSSPRAADIAFASVGDEFALVRAVPGQLNEYVLHALGAESSDLPTTAMLRNGFYVRETPSGVRLVFVVTIKRGGNERTLLRTNLRQALSSFGEELAGKILWIPLMGTGAAGLSMETSLEITLEVLLKARLGMPGHPTRVMIDLPLDLPRGTRMMLYREAQALVMGGSGRNMDYRQPATVSRLVERSRNPVATPGEPHGDPARERALVALLSELFDDDGLRQWVRLTLGKEVHQALPGAPVPFDVLCFRLVLQVQQRGLVNEEFFTRLTDVRPLQSDGIREVAVLWHERSQTQPHYPDDRTRLLSQRLADAYARKQTLKAAGANTSEVMQEILRLKRAIRSGGQLRPGDRLGENRYLLLERIGRGGFANVWKALDQMSGEHVAIKVLHSELAGDVIRRGRFFRGARIMAELDHPAVVRILEPHAEDDGYHYFVMELVSGGDLRQAVLQDRVNVSMVVPFVLTLGDALAKAHARRFIHRDIKPANVLMNESAEPRLTDFDLVAAGDTTGGTQTGALGTFVYAAPEMLERPQDADARADVYGLGMTAAFMLHRADLPRSVLRDAAGFIAKLSCDEPLKRILQKAVAWEPEDRFGDAAAFCQALREYAQPTLGIEAVRPVHPSSAADLDESFIEPNTGIRFILVSGGRFTMGAQRLLKECLPLHQVQISSFWLAETPVTRAQYERFLQASGRSEPLTWDEPRFGDLDQPVVGMTWLHAYAFCQWASEVSELPVVLPTEAQWEFAARGEDGRPYPWGGEEPNELRAHFGRNWITDGPLPVGSLPGSRGPFGHLDQAGNVWEWCLDTWDPSAYSGRRDTLARDPLVLKWSPHRGGSALSRVANDASIRVVRGGGFTSTAIELHAAYRNSWDSHHGAQGIGFRVAVLPRFPEKALALDDEDARHEHHGNGGDAPSSR